MLRIDGQGTEASRLAELCSAEISLQSLCMPDKGLEQSHINQGCDEMCKDGDTCVGYLDTTFQLPAALSRGEVLRSGAFKGAKEGASAKGMHC